MANKPIGQRYSLTYMSRGELKSDSTEFRFRLAKLMSKERFHPKKKKRYSQDWMADRSLMEEALEDDLGFVFATIGRRDWVTFFEKISLMKALDAITIAHKQMKETVGPQDFISQVNRIFSEENLAFTVDDEGGVHPVIDTVFSKSNTEVILGLSQERYDLSRSRIEQIDPLIMGVNPDFIGAIRAAFGAAENLFKLMYSSARLDEGSAKNKMEPQLQRLYAEDAVMLRSNAQILESFLSWIDAAHHYRHEPGSEQPTQPSSELAIALISQGLTFTRWLVAIDQKQLRL